MTERESLLKEQAYKEVKKYEKLIQQDPYRLSYHLMPLVGLLNDPNGLIQFKGAYHVFYQWNPFDTAHGAKFWGHYSSVDMVNWKEEPIALAPSEWYEKNGCYSGSAIESDGKLYLFYTGNVKSDDGARETYQCLAVSTDGVHFEKKGPVLKLPDGYTAHFRDPKVWKKNDRWYMIIGAQTLEEEGAAVLFVSDDLYQWEELGPIAGSRKNGLGDFGYMWECPDLIQLQSKEVLLVSPQGLEPNGYLYNNLFQSGYFVGTLDYETAQYQHGDFVELDRGFDFYAPQTFRDESGRTILYAWMGITDESEPYQPTIANHWVHALTIPRELELRDGQIFQKPAAELKNLRKDEVFFDYGKHDSLDGVCAAEMELDFAEPVDGTFEINFRGEAVLSYDSSKLEISLQRRNMKTGLSEKRVCMLDKLSKLQIFMDHSSLEIFVNGGQEMFTARYFPQPEDQTISFNGTASFRLKKWSLGG
ncbi:sucrose-6-phosphate hydrolase [Neobacillus kokaensis]|uniref:Sucrose-6-phosphate hydrolase n=1 Tax=Neobacillus kokaensis TaxID=2759023 RepID=A0ABQ3NCG0_9BACI|nr:sucrose-6-phosphate hydrolase [Neobacillus kokaensis]GHI01606.1 sucrose-6-phosphate hydrolase [Neobacillus kokaensis]